MNYRVECIAQLVRLRGYCTPTYGPGVRLARGLGRFSPRGKPTEQAGEDFDTHKEFMRRLELRRVRPFNACMELDRRVRT